MASTVFSNPSDQDAYEKIRVALRHCTLQHFVETVGRSIPMLAAAIENGIHIDEIKTLFPDPCYLQYEDLLRASNAAWKPMQQLVEFWITTNPNATPNENLTYARILKHAIKPGDRLSPSLESWLDTIALKQHQSAMLEYISDIYKATGKCMLQWLQNHVENQRLSLETVLLAALSTQEPPERIIKLLSSVLDKRIEGINALLRYDLENKLAFSASQSNQAIHDVVNPLWMLSLSPETAVYAEEIYKYIHRIEIPEKATLQDTVNMLTTFVLKGNLKHPLWDTGAILLHKYIHQKNELTEDDISTYEGQMVSALLEVFKFPLSYQERYFNSHSDMISHYLRTVPDPLSSVPLGRALQTPLLREHLLEKESLTLAKKLAKWFLNVDSTRAPNLDLLFTESLVKSIEIPDSKNQTAPITYDMLLSTFLQGYASIEEAQKHYVELSELSGMEPQEIATNVLFQGFNGGPPVMPSGYSFGT
jgi:hypothetical protein